MLFSVLLTFALTILIKCEGYLQKNYDLNTVLEETTTFFEKLKQDYELQNLNRNIVFEINSKVKEYVQNFADTSLVRHKRELPGDSNKDISVLDGFEDHSELNFNDVKDVNFFPLQIELEPVWVVAVLNAANLSLFQNHDFYPIATYPLTNGSRIIVNSCAYGSLIIVQNKDGSVLVLRFTKTKDNYHLYPLQDFEPNDVTHLTVWQGMNQLYLGVASRTNISIFTWLGDYFDLIQVINIGTEKLVPFYSKGFMYLAATGPVTYIFKYFFKSDEFAVTQRLPSSQDVSFFQLREGHFMEHFLTLSTQSFLVIYKEVHDRFIPFQRISPGVSTVPIISNKAILILSMHKDTIVIHQYDGWKFVELNVKLSGVYQFRQVLLREKELLLVRYKNGTWLLKEPTWSRRKSYKNLQAEIKAWSIDAKNMAQRKLREIPEIKAPVQILRGHINQLFVDNVNDHNSDELKDASNRYKDVASKVQELKEMMDTKTKRNNFTLSALRARNVQIKCRTKCKINRLNVKENSRLLSKLKTQRNSNEIVNLEAMSVKELPKWKCPLLSLPIERITVNKLVNEISLDDLEKNVLKLTGNQEISGEHVYANLEVTNAFIPLDIASNFSKQEIEAREIRVKEFNLTEGGFLLPLNGSFTVITGSIRAAKMKVNGNITLQGELTGTWAKSLSPVTLITEPMTLNGDITLENATIETLRSPDLIDQNVGSIKNILSNAIPLQDSVPVSVTLSSDKVKWNNVIFNDPQKWITADSQSTIAITGRKYFLNKVEITEASRDNLKYPKIETPLCGVSVLAPAITVSLLEVNNLDVQRLKSFRTFGSLGEEYLSSDSKTIFKPLNLSTERFYYNIIAKNISVTNIPDVDFTGLKRLANSWIEPNTFKSSVNATDIAINTLELPAKFHVSLPTVVRNIVSEKNAHVGTINNVNFLEILDNMIEVDNMMSLGNITFNKGFAVNYTFTSQVPFSLTPLEENMNFHRKILSGNIEAKGINLPYDFEFTEDGTTSNIIVEGSSMFSTEPTIQNINNINLVELLTKVWIAEDETNFSGANLHFMNASLNEKITLNDSFSTLHPESWKNISERVLSKTKQQEINVSSAFNSVNVPTIKGSDISRIKSNIPDFNDMFDNAFVRDKPQRVMAKWTFNKLNVTGKFEAKGRINNMNLKTDVLRHDTKENVVTGKKTIVVLTAENLNGLKFNDFADTALKRRNKMIIIKGHKTFNNVIFNNINVSGTVMGYNIKEVLLKSVDQTVQSQKTIQGSVKASEIIIDGLVNDVNLTNLINIQLKKEKSVQSIKTEIRLENTLKILGNVTIGRSYGDTEWGNLYKNDSNAPDVAGKIEKYSEVAETINIALRNRAIYINKFEPIKEINNTNLLNRNITIEEEYCKTKNISQLCTNEHVANIVLKSNLSDLVLIKSIPLNEHEFVVWIKIDSVSIYLYNDVEKSLYLLKELNIRRIMDAFVETMSHSIWIVLRLVSQTLTLHYFPWNNVQQYVLPATEVFMMNKSPNNQLLLLLSDGVWNLEGMANPQHILQTPLKGEIETFNDSLYYYLKYSINNSTSLIKVRYVGN